MKYLATVMIMALLSGSALAVDYGTGLSYDETVIMSMSNDCKPHENTDFSESDNEIAADAYVLLYCANYVRLRENNYKLGWKLHKEASILLNKLEACKCPLHLHVNQMAYQTFIRVTEDLNSDELPNKSIIDLCNLPNLKEELVAQ